MSKKTVESYEMSSYIRHQVFYLKKNNENYASSLVQHISFNLTCYKYHSFIKVSAEVNFFIKVRLSRISFILDSLNLLSLQHCSMLINFS